MGFTAQRSYFPAWKFLFASSWLQVAKYTCCYRNSGSEIKGTFSNKRAVKAVLSPVYVHGVPLSDTFAPTWHVPQCCGGDVGSHQPLAGADRSLPGGGLWPRALPPLVAAGHLCVTARSCVQLMMACSSPAGTWRCEAWRVLLPLCPNHRAQYPQPVQPPSYLQPPPCCASPVPAPPAPPPAVPRSSVGSVGCGGRSRRSIPGGGRQRRLLLRQSGPGRGAGTDSAGLREPRPHPRRRGPVRGAAPARTGAGAPGLYLRGGWRRGGQHHEVGAAPTVAAAGLPGPPRPLPVGLGAPPAR